MLSLGSYLIGCILLSGLFFYDIFWVKWPGYLSLRLFVACNRAGLQSRNGPLIQVFGTEVMVSVAKGLDAPVKILFPKVKAATRAHVLPPAGGDANRLPPLRPSV